MNQENFPIPKGFSLEEDVTINAHLLFTDTFMMLNKHVMTLFGLTGYALMAEVGLYAEDGAQLLIKYGWLVQPPLADDREKSANNEVMCYLYNIFT